MTGAGAASDTRIRARTEVALREGHICAGAFVQVLRDEGVQIPKALEDVVPALDHGIGGSGSVCGVFLAAMLASALEDSAGMDEAAAGPGEAPPANEWLDAFIPASRGAPSARATSSLAKRLTAFAEGEYGGFDCQHISGVEWPLHSPISWARYFSSGGADRCTQFVVEAARAFIESPKAGQGPA